MKIIDSLKNKNVKKFLILFVIVILIVSIIAVRYSSYKVEHDTIMQENAEFEQYKDKECEKIFDINNFDDNFSYSYTLYYLYSDV